MKKIINQPETTVLEMCHGLVLAHPELELIPDYKVVKKKHLSPDQVQLICGGGSGHEPAHAGFVGKGMLDAAVCGDVFASPSQIQVYQAIRAVAGKQGVLLIIKNYSGDMMNFRNAAYLAQEDGIAVEYVKVDDDIAVEDSLYTVGRRGVAGTVLVQKIAGAAAEQGKSLGEVKEVALQAAANVRSLGFAYSSCTVPAKGSPTFELADAEMEYGVGIHGEPGIRREPIATADELAHRMVDALCQDLTLEAQQRVALLVNGFGATPLMELYVLNHAVRRELHQRNIVVARTFVGNYVTSIDMAGASLSLLKLDDTLEPLLHQPCDAPGFTVRGPVDEVAYADPFASTSSQEAASFAVETKPEAAVIGERLTLHNLVYIVDVMCESIIRNEVPFCELDAHAGDGDFGMSVAKGFKQLKREWKTLVSDKELTMGSFLEQCSLIIMEHCGGASGPIWGSAFRAAGKQVGSKQELSVSEFAQMMEAAVSGIQKTGERSFGRGAVVGDKTLIDALIPCCEAFKQAAEAGTSFVAAFVLGAKAAVQGAEHTKEIVARMGRAGTVGDRSLGHPDAGAFGLGVIFTDIAKSLTAKAGN